MQKRSKLVITEPIPTTIYERFFSTYLHSENLTEKPLKTHFHILSLKRLDFKANFEADHIQLLWQTLLNVPNDHSAKFHCCMETQRKAKTKATRASLLVFITHDANIFLYLSFSRADFQVVRVLTHVAVTLEIDLSQVFI